MASISLRRSGEPGRSQHRQHRLLGYAMLAPALLYIFGLVGVPFILALWYSVSNVSVTNLSGHFVGLDNFRSLLHDPTFRHSIWVTLLYTFFSVVVVGILGTLLGFVLLEDFRGKRFLRFMILLPWTIPIALTVLGWKWMFDSQYSVFNWLLIKGHIIHGPVGIQWLGRTNTALGAVIAVNVWRNFPFAAIILLAGLTSIPPDIIDAAKIDGASAWVRFNQIIVPMIFPILFIGLLFNIVFTMTDLTVVYLLTQGGPANATQVMANYAFQVGIVSGDLSHGAAITLFLFPVLFALSIIFLRQLTRKGVEA